MIKNQDQTIHNNRAAFEVCRHSLHLLYDVNNEEQAKRELWDMLMIASGETPNRKWGGADASFTDDGRVELEKKLAVPVEAVDVEINVGGTQ